MQISITGRHTDISPAVKEHVASRLARLHRFVEPMEVQVTLGTEKSRHRAEITLRDSTGSYFAAEESHELLASIDQAVERLEAQAKRHRDKIIDAHHGRRAQEAKLNFLSSEPEEPENRFGPY